MVRLPTSRPAGQHFTPFQRGMLSAVMAVVSVGVIYLWMCGFLGAQKQKNRTVIHAAREAVLREDCHVVRQAIDSYTFDLQKAPMSLDDLIQAGYLKALPKDFSLEACR
jgi:general secretion pathway protein G